jgi:hypothetical protein
VQKGLPMRTAFDEGIEDGLTAKLGIDDFAKIIESPRENLN